MKRSIRIRHRCARCHSVFLPSIAMFAIILPNSFAEAQIKGDPKDPLQSLPPDLRKDVDPDGTGSDDPEAEGEENVTKKNPKIQEVDQSGSSSKTKVVRPEDRLPKLETPDRSSSRNPSKEANGVLKSPLVSVNKSGVEPQVLKKPKGAGSVKGMGITFQTNLQTGSASLGVPISLPPARRGFGPGLSLGYSSGGGQGVAGLGWSLGAGYIARQTDQGLPRYDDDVDHFVYNGGKELVRVDPGDEQLPAWADPDHYYRAKIEGLFMRFFLLNAGTDNAYWVAQDKDGTLYYFGGTAEGMDTEALICESDGTKIFRWNLILTVDVHGNQVRYDFFKHQGRPYLSEVQYNNHPVLPKYQHRVVIEYQNRDDVLTTYQPGYPVTTAYRIKEISAYTDYGVVIPFSSRPTDGDGRMLVRRYKLTYIPDMLHSLLQKVQMCGTDGATCLPPAEFEYSEVSGTHSVPEMGDLDGTVLDLAGSPADSIGDGRRDLLDVDGDGLPDVYETDPLNPGTMPQYILNTGASLSEANRMEMGGGDGLMLWNTNVNLMDVDGDGYSEMMHMPLTGSYNTYRSACEPLSGSQTGERRACSWDVPESAPTNPHIDLTTDAEEIKLVDINGDHLTDVVRTTGTQMQHWINLGRYEGGQGRFGQVLPDGSLSDQPITSCVLHKGMPVMFSDPRVKLADMNGDGLQDIVLVDYGTFVYWPNKGWGNWGEGPHCPAGQYGSNRHITMDNAPYFSSMDPKKVYLGDVNGDGLADMIQVRANAVDVWLNAIDHFKDRAVINQSPWAPQFTDRVRLADMNGSGSRDILWGDGGNYRYMDLTSGIKPRIITRMKNGLGGITEITYESSTEQYLRDRAEGNEWETYSPFPTQVVTEVKVRDQFDQVGNGWTEGVYVTKYYYRNAYYDGIEHEYRGFAEVTEEKVGDSNSPTSFVTHHYYQGIEDEALTGTEYRTDVWAYGDGGSGSIVYDSTSWTSFAIRTIRDAHPMDLEPGRPIESAFDRRIRLTYPVETHSFGYNTVDYVAGPHTQSGLLRIRFEGPGGQSPQDETTDLELPADSSITTHIKGAQVVDDMGQTLEGIAYGQVGVDLNITKHATYVRNEEKWIHRSCESWVTGEGDETAYNHTLVSFDGTPSTWGSSPGQGQCFVGDKGNNTKGEFRIYYPGDPERTIEEHLTEYTDFGLQRHTRALKKMESWFYYEDPAGYQALPTREVMRVGTNGPVPGENPEDPDRYPDTIIKYLTTRVSYDIGLGHITELRDYNHQKTQAVYDSLGRITEIWLPHIPTSICPDMKVPSEKLTYHIPGVQGTQYSLIHREYSEDACDSTKILHQFAYIDGLGRTRLIVTEGDENPVDSFHTPWIAKGFQEYNSRGGVSGTLGAAFIDWVPGAQAPQPVHENNCTDDDSIDDSSVCRISTTYDYFGRPIEIQFPDQTITRKIHRGPLLTEDWDGNDSNSLSEFFGTPTTIRKDGHGRVIEVIKINLGATGQSVEIHDVLIRDSLGNILVLVQDSTGEGVETQQYLDSVGQKRLFVHPDAGPWHFEYDDTGNMRRSEDPNGNIILYGYDNANRLLWEDCISCPISQTCIIGPEVRYFYDSPVRMKGGRGYMPEEVGSASGFDEPQDYLLGRLSWLEDETGEIYASYNVRGLQVTEAQHINEKWSQLLNDYVGTGEYYIGRKIYDSMNRTVNMELPDQKKTKIVIEYNNRGNVKEINSVENGQSPDQTVYFTDVKYNAENRKTSFVLQDDAFTINQNTFDRNGRIRKKIYIQQLGYGYTLMDRKYWYDGASNVKTIEDLRLYEDVAGDQGYAPGNPPYDAHFEYDALYRLVKSTYRDTLTDDVRRMMVYVYDNIGNMVERNTTNESGEYNPIEEYYRNWLGTMIYDQTYKHRLVMANGGEGRKIEIGYDNVGNIKELAVYNVDKTTQYAYNWDHYNNLKSVIKKEQSSITDISEYFYDHSGERVIKGEKNIALMSDISNTNYISSAFEVRDGEDIIHIYEGINRVVTRKANVNKYKLYDNIGSLTVTVGQTGEVVNTFSYLPYGAVEAKTGNTDEKYTFSGKEYEQELDIMYFGSRYLNIYLCRWISIDRMDITGVGERIESYIYVNGNPIRYRDSDGNAGVEINFRKNGNVKLMQALVSNRKINNITITVSIDKEKEIEDTNYRLKVPKNGGSYLKADTIHIVTKNEREFGAALKILAKGYKIRNKMGRQNPNITIMGHSYTEDVRKNGKIVDREYYIKIGDKYYGKDNPITNLFNKGGALNNDEKELMFNSGTKIDMYMTMCGTTGYKEAMTVPKDNEIKTMAEFAELMKTNWNINIKWPVTARNGKPVTSTIVGTESDIIIEEGNELKELNRRTGFIREMYMNTETEEPIYLHHNEILSWKRDSKE